MGRTSAGTTCPKCRQYAPLRKDGTLGEHRTEFYVIGQRRGGRRRERCAYAGVTPIEAAAGITSLKKRVEAYQAAKRKEADRA